MARRPRLLKPISIGAILSAGVLGKRSAEWVRLYQLKKSWPEIVGQEMAKRTLPKRVYRKLVVISVENAVWAQQLSLMKDELLKAISDRTGNLFYDIRFINEPLTSTQESGK